MSKTLEAIEANQPLVKMIDRFISDREGLGEYNGRTAEVTRNRLYMFARQMRGIPPWEMTRTHIKDWLASMPHVRPGTRAVRFSSVNTLFEWAITEGILSHNPCTGVKRPRRPKGENRALTKEEIARLQAHIYDVSPKRGMLMFSLMYWEGMRCAEVARLQLHDIDFSEKVIHVRGKNFGGERSRSVVMSPETAEALQRYLLGRKIDSGPVFRSMNNSDVGASPRQISERMSSYMAGAGIKHGAYDGVSAHALRHTAAEEMAKAASDLRVVSQFLGHQNFATTQIYLRNEVEGQAEAMTARAAERNPPPPIPSFFEEAEA